jgi:hypothetical protein
MPSAGWATSTPPSNRRRAIKIMESAIDVCVAKHLIDKYLVRRDRGRPADFDA